MNLNIFKIKKKKVISPNFIIINVNEECFFKCQMCFKWKPDINIKEGLQKISVIDVQKFIDNLSKITKKGTEITFAGGEPLLRKDIFDMINYAFISGFTTSLSTNGWLVNEKIAKKIVDSGLDKIIFSVDGKNKNTHDKIRGMPGSYDKIIKAIDYISNYKSIKKSKISIGIQMVMMKQNLDETLDMIKWVEESDKIDTIHINALSEPNNTVHDPNWFKNAYAHLWPEDKKEIDKITNKLIEYRKKSPTISKSINRLIAFQKYFKEPEKFVKNGPCNFDKAITLSSTGDIFMCNVYGSIGNIRKIDLEKEWYSKNAESIRNTIHNCKKNCHFLINCYYEE